jgi:hypothetical protein
MLNTRHRIAARVQVKELGLKYNSLPLDKRELRVLVAACKLLGIENILERYGDDNVRHALNQLLESGI